MIHQFSQIGNISESGNERFGLVWFGLVWFDLVWFGLSSPGGKEGGRGAQLD